MPLNWTRVLQASWPQLLLLDLSTKLLLRQVGDFRLNHGISAGLGEQLPSNLIIGISLLVLLWLWMKLESAPEWLILIGGWGNLLDRMYFGAVTDWISLPLVGLWFNLADIYITLGLVIFIYQQIKQSQQNSYGTATANL